MSFFGRSQPTSAQIMAMAEQEIEMMQVTFNAMNRACHSKCISSKYHDPDLNKGESVCVDRCAAKFVQVFKTLSEKMQQQQQQMQPLGQSLL
ncbi:hypothetical protein MP638_003550 [Amoeboaphelidium occidentale]|nr:hypothetical protein MP638_003550 [Amoeboaphelidium occidentale]